ncbi:hypothetical protein [Rhizorhabdus histidinilytica]|uniref:Uncharacterized protein n=2 Tax=Rhizorhabdus histidinilytica TaxID=439228 RepID=A0A1T5B596_9SPHN|nr:hypothetical protein [Rhizorhabdus histidinilytica]SKB42441.1 hypothetical protein SAMN06295920_102503 [Rhizorhabdus histidinilytica]
MIGTSERNLIRDKSGRAPYKLALGGCLVAFAAATSSPAFEANPLLGKAVHELRRQLPTTLDTVRKAMGG